MIITPQDQSLRLITQNDHAHFSAEILSLWVTDGLPEHPRRRELIFAAREHDNGWREPDSAPHCNVATGNPHDFMSMPSEERWRIWQRGPRRFASREPYASLLINHHAQTLYGDHRGDAAWADVFAAWRKLEEELLEETGIDKDEMVDDYRWVDLTDLLSLVACAGRTPAIDWTQPRKRYGFRMEVRDNDLIVDPFPLAGATTFQVRCREIPDRRYSSDTDLAMELASARWREVAIRVVPADPPSADSLIQ